MVIMIKTERKEIGRPKRQASENGVVTMKEPCVTNYDNYWHDWTTQKTQHMPYAYCKQVPLCAMQNTR